LAITSVDRILVLLFCRVVPLHLLSFRRLCRLFFLILLLKWNPFCQRFRPRGLGVRLSQRVCNVVDVSGLHRMFMMILASLHFEATPFAVVFFGRNRATQQTWLQFYPFPSLSPGDYLLTVLPDRCHLWQLVSPNRIRLPPTPDPPRRDTDFSPQTRSLFRIASCPGLIPCFVFSFSSFVTPRRVPLCGRPFEIAHFQGDSLSAYSGFFQSLVFQVSRAGRFLRFFVLFFCEGHTCLLILFHFVSPTFPGPHRSLYDPSHSAA